MYGNIKDEDLDLSLLWDSWDEELISTRKAIDTLCLDEEIIFAKYNVINSSLDLVPMVEHFTAWTESFVITKVSYLDGNSCLLVLDRNPPEQKE